MKFILPLSLLIVLTSCQLEEEGKLSSETENEQISEAVEAGITSLSAIMDEESDEDFAKAEKSLLEDLIIPRAYAANCFGRAAGQVCESGVKTVQYDDCTIGTSNHSLTGRVQLEYSDSSCDMSTNGSSVTRTYSLIRISPVGAKVEKFSENGGTTLTRTSDSEYSLRIDGKRKKRTRPNGRAGFDISLKTLRDLEIQGGLRRSQRQVTNGSIEISHNRLNYQTVMTASNLEYSSTCCYPVSGSVSLTYSGSIEGSGEVNFLSCGEAELIKDGEIYPIEFYTCE